MGGVAVCAKNDLPVAAPKSQRQSKALHAVVDFDPSLPWAREARRSRRSEWPTRGRYRISGCVGIFAPKPGARDSELRLGTG